MRNFWRQNNAHLLPQTQSFACWINAPEYGKRAACEIIEPLTVVHAKCVNVIEMFTVR